MKRLGITTTVPTEVLLAAGYQPVDLNNIFVNDPHPERLVSIAERAGFPLDCCTWIKGIYGVCQDYSIDTVLCVTSGDCSNTLMLLEVLKLGGIRTLTFAYPDHPDLSRMRQTLEEFATLLGTTLDEAAEVRKQLEPARLLALKLDELTWKDNLVRGSENHLWLVSASDFNQDVTRYSQQLRELLDECGQRQPLPADSLRLAYIGVPPVFAREFYPFLERNGGRVVFNEIQRQFAMPEPVSSLAEQYCNYTYPYSLQERLRDITAEIARRQVDGVIHYVQAFCHRGIADIIFRKTLELPVLTIEGNTNFFLSNHLKTRLEAFLDMLRRSRHRSGTGSTGSHFRKELINKGGAR
ncbi:2-hydroxyacyl-CoA dehydratase family protein [Chloroflexota bacterium]